MPSTKAGTLKNKQLFRNNYLFKIWAASVELGTLCLTMYRNLRRSFYAFPYMLQNSRTFVSSLERYGQRLGSINFYTQNQTLEIFEKLYLPMIACFSFVMLYTTKTWQYGTLSVRSNSILWTALALTLWYFVWCLSSSCRTFFKRDNITGEQNQIILTFFVFSCF